MSEKYNYYIREHKKNVTKGFEWLRNNLPEIFEDVLMINTCENIALLNFINEHDRSKYEAEEYNAYDEYFYGRNQSYEVVQDYNKAWLHHIHNNPHHWQHWILINDDPGKGEIILDMPDVYIIEMICDWWSFSWKQDNLNEIFKWYEEHKDYIKLSDYTRKKVEDILDRIRKKLSESDADAEQ